VGTATVYRLEGRGSILVGGKKFVYAIKCRPALETHPLSCPLGDGDSLPEDKAPGAWS
jgi:hypothetical protein